MQRVSENRAKPKSLHQSRVDVELGILLSIFKNILTDPDNKTHKNLNFNTLKQILGKENLELLYKAGFYRSENSERLLFDALKSDNLRITYSCLLASIEQNCQQPQKRIDSNHFILNLNESDNNNTELRGNINTIIQSEHLFTSTRIYHNHHKCKLEQCLCLQIVGYILKEYNLYIRNNQKNDTYQIQKMYDKIGNNYNNTDLLDDYNHLLMHHASQFEDIYNILCGDHYNLTCNLSKCLLMRRHRRNRSEITKNESILNNLYFHNDTIVSQQLIDRIHCHFLHTFDIGFRITQQEKQNMSHEETKFDFNDIDNDNNVSQINDLIAYKQTLNDHNINTVSNQLNNKFCENTYIYEYGIRYNYWNDYTNLCETVYNTMAPPNFRKTFAVWCIQNKYKDLQEELLINAIYHISKLQWIHLNKKALNHLTTQVVRQMYCPRKESAMCYEMIYGQTMRVNHLIALMVYCNYDTLQLKFTETFRRLNKNESDKHLKERHSNYYFVARLMRECVECFGMRYANNYTIKVYRGVNKHFLFPSMFALVKGPFSTTLDYSVAVNFSQNTGMILELTIRTDTWIMQMNESEATRQRICCFDCQWISDFSNESEILCCGGLNELFVDNIIESTSGKNYQKYIRGLQQITADMSNEAWTTFYNTGSGDIIQYATTMYEAQMMYRLLSHQLFMYKPYHKLANEFKSCPPYIKTLLHLHCQNIHHIHFCYDIHHSASYNYNTDIILINQFHFQTQDLFFLKHENNYKGLINLDLLTTIFPNVMEIIADIPNLTIEAFFADLFLFIQKNASIKHFEIYVDLTFKNELMRLIKQYIKHFNHQLWHILWYNSMSNDKYSMSDNRNVNYKPLSNLSRSHKKTSDWFHKHLMRSMSFDSSVEEFLLQERQNLENLKKPKICIHFFKGHEKFEQKFEEIGEGILY